MTWGRKISTKNISAEWVNAFMEQNSHAKVPPQTPTNDGQPFSFFLIHGWAESKRVLKAGVVTE